MTDNTKQKRYYVEICSVSGDILIYDNETTHCMAKCFSNEYAEQISNALNKCGHQEYTVGEGLL